MRASRFSEEQIVGILREQEAGAKTPEVCRRHGISDATPRGAEQLGLYCAADEVLLGSGRKRMQ
jgi:hypothetical protein